MNNIKEFGIVNEYITKKIKNFVNGDNRIFQDSLLYSTKGVYLMDTVMKTNMV
jgi:hypothetical protein